MWRFRDAQTAEAAFAELRDDTADSVSRLGNVVFTSRIPDNVEFDAFDDDFEAQMAAVEERANHDPRLDTLAGAVWRRAFGQVHPQLIVVTDHKQADEIIGETEDLPYNIGEYVPIAPWTPKVTLTDQQTDLQNRLRVLQGKADETPWEQAERLRKDQDEAELSPEAFREFMRLSAERIEQTQENRLKWIRDQAESTTGNIKRLYTAYVDFEVDSKAWREDERPFDDKGSAPAVDGLSETLAAGTRIPSRTASAVYDRRHDRRI